MIFKKSWMEQVNGFLKDSPDRADEDVENTNLRMLAVQILGNFYCFWMELKKTL